MDRTWLERELRAGRSIESIAREVGRHPSTVAYWVRRYEIARAPSRHAARGAIARSELERLVAEDLTVREIAARTGRSATTVRYWLGRYGLATTPRARTKRARGRPRVVGMCEVHGAVEFIQHRSGDRTCVSCRADAVTAWRRRAKAILVAEAGGACVICGYDRSQVALQFHHVDPAQKRFGLGGRGLARSIDALREEAAKCVLLCSNCHAEVEAGIVTLRLPCGGSSGPEGVARDPG